MYEYIGTAGWQPSSVYDLANWKNGLAFKNIDFSVTGRPIIKIAELKNGVTGQTARTMAEYDPSVLVHPGDMLFSWSGNPDTSIDVFRWEREEGWLNQHNFKVTPNNRILAEFLFFLLKWLRPRFAEIARNKQTTGLGHVTIQDLKRMMVGLPTLPEQEAIVCVLAPVQSKLDLNRRMNETLEATAEAAP
jgi:type I restriction enzyme S subunit